MPNEAEGPKNKYNPEKRDLLQSLELLIIDEISMVRPDRIDQIDLILCRLKGMFILLGGQLLMIGDLAQLSPIIREDEWSLLRPYYSTPCFFSSLVLQHNPYVRIELKKFTLKRSRFRSNRNVMRIQNINTTELAARIRGSFPIPS